MVSKNQISLEHLEIACRHVEELIKAGVTKNLAIRSLEIFADVYAKLHTGSSATPHHVKQVTHWSKAARKMARENPDVAARPGGFLRVEHGTPRRAFASQVLSLYQTGKLSSRTMNALVRKKWKLAVITLEEDRELNRIARSVPSATPDERWRLAKITF